jgi:hypothetical protein
MLAGLFGQTVPAQSTRREAARKGPRALGLLELVANGKARLIPITVMFDGKFYDGGFYKASPIPMALEQDTVYEGVRTGVSQGLFTVGGAFHRGNAWIADGKWEPAGAVPPKKRPLQPPAAAPRDDDQDKPPVLRRPGSGSGSEAPKPAPPVAPPSDTPVATAPAPAPAPAPVSPEQNSQDNDNDNDKDRPVLRRGKQTSSSAKREPNNTTAMSSPARVASNLPAANTGEQKIGGEKPALQITAISDAVVSEPHPYSYMVKPAEEQQLREKMLALATNEIRDRTRQLASEDAKPAPVRNSSQKNKTPASRSAPPSFEDTQFQIFDLSNANEPVLVLTTTASFPTKSNSGANPYYVALVTREDISGELHKAFSNVTDSRHLDIQPRLELIDAVDADGDGRGELLFRQISDKGSAFVIYRVIGEQLWALFQGTPE